MKIKSTSNNVSPVAMSFASVVEQMAIALESIVESNEAYSSFCKAQNIQPAISAFEIENGRKALQAFYCLIKPDSNHN